MEKHIVFLRLSYWIPALADFGIAGLALFPGRMGVNEIVYPMGLTSVIAFSWGVMLLIADRKPMERRWVLIPTILVVALVTAARIIFSTAGIMDFSIGILLFGTGLVLFMAFSYRYANVIGARHRTG